MSEKDKKISSKLQLSYARNLKVGSSSTNRNSKYNDKNNKNKSKDNDDHYAVQICGNCTPVKYLKDDKFMLACLSSDRKITLYDRSLQKITQIVDAHKRSQINEINFFKMDNNMIISCGDDAIVKCWDVRKPLKEVIKFDQSDDDVKFLSADINCDDKYIVAGTSSNKDQEAFIYFFDVKMTRNSLIKKYTDAHSNDITQVKFDYLKPNRFISASTDGLACLFDLNFLKDHTNTIARPSANTSDKSDNENDEDDDLIEQTFNIDVPIQKIGFLNDNKFYAITYTDDLFVYDLESYDECLRIMLSNETTKKSNYDNCDYVVDCFDYENRLIECLGKRDGRLQLYENKNLVFKSDDEKKLPKSHRDIVRSLYYYDRNVYTVSEDGELFKWDLTEEQPAETSKKQTKRPISEDEDEKSDKLRESKKKSNKIK